MVELLAETGELTSAVAAAPHAEREGLTRRRESIERRPTRGAALPTRRRAERRTTIGPSRMRVVVAATAASTTHGSADGPLTADRSHHVVPHGTARPSPVPRPRGRSRSWPGALPVAERWDEIACCTAPSAIGVERRGDADRREVLEAGLDVAAARLLVDVEARGQLGNRVVDGGAVGQELPHRGRGRVERVVAQIDGDTTTVSPSTTPAAAPATPNRWWFATPAGQPGSEDGGGGPTSFRIATSGGRRGCRCR